MKLAVKIGDAIVGYAEGNKNIYYAGEINGDFLTLCYEDGREYKTLHEEEVERRYRKLPPEQRKEDFQIKKVVKAYEVDNQTLWFNGELYTKS